MDITSVAGETKTIPVRFGDVEEQVGYHPNVYTLGFARLLNELVTSEDAMKLGEIFEVLIASWGLTENGEPIPTTAEGIERVPLSLLKVIQEAISEDQEPAEDEKRGSSEPSSIPSGDSMQPPPTSPNGSETSPSPTVSASQ